MIGLLRQLIFGIDSYTNQQINIINNSKNNFIIKMFVCKKPINKLIKQSMNILTLNKLNDNLRNSPYDDIYHLYMIIILNDNKRILIEKNERIEIRYLKVNEFFNLINVNDIKKTNLKTIVITLYNNISFVDLLNNTNLYMGNNYFIYDSSKYNCQNFILNILISNNLYNDIYYNFIYQNPVYFYHNLKFLSKVNKNITNIAAKVNLLQTGSGVIKIYDKNNNKIKFTIDSINNVNPIKIDDKYIYFIKKINQ